MRRVLLSATLGSLACAIEYRVPGEDTSTDSDGDTDAATSTPDELECEHLCDDAREVCAAGEVCLCREGFVECGGTCVDLETDPSHCGECNRSCGGDPCGGGECRPEGCGAFPSQCGDSCTDVASDPLHCRECGRACDGDELCIDGDCEDFD